MRRFVIVSCVLAFAWGVQASWYWPFGSDENETEPPRISELMEPASLLIDEASDFAAEGKVDEAVEKYRKALAELDRIEMENPERAKGSEFATLRNKRAYVNAAIDSMLLSQVKQNAKVVAVSDTTELEKRLAEERKSKTRTKDARSSESKEESEKSDESVKTAKAEKPVEPKKAVKPAVAARPPSRRELVIDAISRGAYADAERLIGEMLSDHPNGAAALNLKAALEMRQGKLDVAEATLDQAIMSNPRSYSAYYNLAMLLLQKDVGNKTSARRYYETGRAMGGPENAELEELLR